MSFLQTILCRFGYHIRSKSKAKKTEAGWKSVCRGCGEPMLKLKGGDWQMMMKPPEPTSAERARLREIEARKRRTPPPRRKRPVDR
ncbi:hypothetical protein [Sphingomonas sp.]|uniref:hypothetical protein n=1 Tax=Sphingomonas sp. TaxID=28214 RepID=UPI000DB34EA3|nr:hypothetical protein [Sphingomonas sp.]PZU08180.1 MAG: hypothetical protein DI605_13085 [Sphingomonas sp.]